MQKIKVGINGFGRIGRLALRAAFDTSALEFVKINDPGAGPEVLAHLLNFDSVHGRWQQEATTQGDFLMVAGHQIPVTRYKTLEENDWSDCDLVLECSGKMRNTSMLQGYLNQGVKRVIVSAPVPDVLNVVLGVNEDQFDPERDQILTAASCTTNCLAPIVKVIHEALHIRHGSMTTIHGLTNDQVVLDIPHKDLRRARACGSSLIPTSTNSASAIATIFPELKGRLNGMAVRAPITNASLTDCVFEVAQETSAEAVNALFKAAAEGPLKGILAYEERPLVSADYRTDPHSATVDALSTLVINGTQVKIYAWYDNEWGYANRLVELASKIGKR